MSTSCTPHHQQLLQLAAHPLCTAQEFIKVVQSHYLPFEGGIFSTLHPLPWEVILCCSSHSSQSPEQSTELMSSFSGYKKPPPDCRSMAHIKITEEKNGTAGEMYGTTAGKQAEPNELRIRESENSCCGRFCAPCAGCVARCCKCCPGCVSKACRWLTDCCGWTSPGALHDKWTSTEYEQQLWKNMEEQREKEKEDIKILKTCVCSATAVFITLVAPHSSHRVCTSRS